MMFISKAGYSGAFSLYTEASGAAIGNFGAGLAAEARDATTGWYNPAGLVLLHKQQLVASGIGVFPSTVLSGTTTFRTDGLNPYSETFRGVEAAESAVVPSVHYALPLGENAAFGFSVVSPFGLSTNYPKTAAVRYGATYTQMITVNLSPELGGRITENITIGGGLDLQWARVTFNRMIGAPTLMVLVGNNPTALDSEITNQGTSTGIGYHIGLLGTFNDEHTKIGINYQSKMKHIFHGTSVLKGVLADIDILDTGATFSNHILTSNDVQLPDILALSVYHDVNKKLALLGSVVYTGWSVFKNPTLKNVDVFSPAVGQAVIDSTLVQDYQDTWRFALGANYKLNEKYMLRAGIGYDETPTVDAQRDARLPDANRMALAIGGRYEATKSISVDVGYTYLWATERAVINKTEALGTTSSFTVNASGKGHANLVGLQANWNIDKYFEGNGK